MTIPLPLVYIYLVNEVLRVVARSGQLARPQHDHQLLSREHQGMKCILVTGGAGFIGSCFVRQWLADQREAVINLDTLTYAGNLDSLSSVKDHKRHIFVHGDIADSALVAKLLSGHQPRAVINFAAESHVDRSIDGPAEFVKTNVLGTCQLLESVRRYWECLPRAAAKRFRFLQVSTDEVYGSLGRSGKFRETTTYAPNSPYSASKAAADHFVRAYHHTFGLPTLVTNCSNNYGPYQFPEKLIPLMILNAIEGKPLPVYGDGQQIRDWLFVEDHCQAIRRVLAAAEPGSVYNIGGNCERTNLSIVQSICKAIDRRLPNLPHAPCKSLITHVKDRPGHDRRYAIDARKIRRDLGWQPSVHFEDGLQLTVDWYLSNRRWVNRVTSGTYRRERLGLLRASA
jgi:dTDP-glucose 4,6-dehydratase